MDQPDYLIAGAGLYGAVLAERIANELDQKVVVVESRDHIGGNCYSENDQETGILYHKYGTHIFHTSSEKVFKYISRFTDWNNYFHQVLTTHKGKVYQMPINLETLNSFYNVSLRPFEVEAFLKKEIEKENYPAPKNLEEKAISLIGRPLYEAFIKGYTTKQWGKEPKDLPESIINRLPVRSNYDESYFNNARWQGVPLNGYTPIFEKMLNHPNITLKLGTDYFDIKKSIIPKKMTIYSGPIDRYFEYSLGHLDWRSIKLKRVVVPHDDYQGTSVMNYADTDVEYTRIHEPKHLHTEKNYSKEQSLLFYENSCIDKNAPFYPIKDKKNQELYQKYKLMADNEKSVLFGGRLGSYAYFDMDQAIAQALSIFESTIRRKLS